MQTHKAKQIPIIEYLAKIGYNPKRTKGGDFWYLSPLRREDTPSFKVDTRQNIWYDHGAKQGGSIIDLVMAINHLTVLEALQTLKTLFGTSISNYEKPRACEPKNGFEATNNTNDVIHSIKSLKTQALIEYLQSRKINIDIAKHYLQEVYYQVDGKNFFALGFKNDSNGYELRSKYFKGSLKGSIKDLTTIKQSKESYTLLIFEGFIDFLSLFTVKNFVKPEDLKDDVIILNTLAMLDKSIEQIKASNYKEIHLYLDADEAGRRAVNKLMFSLDNVKIIDMSNIYNGNKDLNEVLVLE
jgi:DNA primase